MSLESEVQKRLLKAMKSKNQAALRALRSIKAAITLTKTEEGFSGTLTKNDELNILEKLIKQRKQSIKIYTEQGREDLAEKEQEEIEVISFFLPKQMSDNEVLKEVKKIIKEVDATSLKDMGKVMGVANQLLAGKDDKSKVASIVKKELQ